MKNRILVIVGFSLFVLGLFVFQEEIIYKDLQERECVFNSRVVKKMNRFTGETGYFLYGATGELLDKASLMGSFVEYCGPIK